MNSKSFNAFTINRLFFIRELCYRASLLLLDCLTAIPFDDIPSISSSSGVIPNGYKNFNWTNAEYVNSSSMSLSGYQTAAFITIPFVAHSPTAAPLTIASANSSTFSFDSVVVAAAWREGLSWTIQGYQGATMTIAGTFGLTTINRTTISCGSCTGLTKLVFITSGGTPRAGLAQNGTQFVLDDLCVSFSY